MSVFNSASLRTTVQGAIEQGQIGRPASLRLTVHGPGGEDDLQSLESDVRDLTSAWFGGPSESEYVTGGPGGPSIIALKWPGGQSAILSISTGAGRTGGNLVLLGSNGAIYHDIDPAPSDNVRVAGTGGE
ncbi:MAG: hypothetical protein J4G14_03355 [Dehalococcoidia bacterium]|nr:hypothetical protein [Dehalococcoidia bacterium]